MQFKYPEILYFLALLVIPLLVHLFHFRKFKKTAFTNVYFLKKITTQTRQSAQLKKWLVLLSRLIALASIIIAFAQPFYAENTAQDTPQTKTIYLDNSFSMQLHGKRGQLLQEAIQGLLKTLSPEETFNLITNDEVYRNRTLSAFKEQLSTLTYSGVSPTFKTTILRVQNHFPSNQHLIVISDFQQNAAPERLLNTDFEKISYIQLSPEKVANISIDSLYLSEITPSYFKLHILLSKTGPSTAPVSIAVHDKNKLVAKTAVQFMESTLQKIELDIARGKNLFQGKVSINDQGLSYDNQLYFTLAEQRKINVIAISDHKTDSQFLARIYQGENFNFIAYQTKNWEYNQLVKANTLILNGIQKIPQSLYSALKKIKEQHGHIVVIPPINESINSYNVLSSLLNIPKYSALQNEKNNITEIAFTHPLYVHVFKEKVKNFHYPSVKKYWELKGALFPVLKFANGAVFLGEKEGVYLFSSNLSEMNSDFQHSALVVPTFYNIALQSLPTPKPYFTVGEKARYVISTSLKKEEVVHLENREFSFIPRQEKSTTSTWITTKDLPKKAGIYRFTQNKALMEGVAYNYPRKESELVYTEMAEFDSLKVAEKVADFFIHEKEQQQIHELWKWFVIFAFGFLLVELLLLKFLK